MSVCVATKLEVSAAFPFPENRRDGDTRRTGGPDATLNVAHHGGPHNNSIIVQAMLFTKHYVAYGEIGRFCVL